MTTKSKPDEFSPTYNDASASELASAIDQDELQLVIRRRRTRGFLMHCVLLYHIGNVLFLVLHTGMATGIRIVSFLTSRSRCTRIEITPFEPDQRSYLRREASSVFHYFLPSSLAREGGPIRNY